jgi:hypothetical protein
MDGCHIPQHVISEIERLNHWDLEMLRLDLEESLDWDEEEVIDYDDDFVVR